MGRCSTESWIRGRISLPSGATTKNPRGCIFRAPWHLQRDLPPISLLSAELASRPGTRRLAYENGGSLRTGTAELIAFLANAVEISAVGPAIITEDRAGLPEGLKRLLELAEAVPREERARAAKRPRVLLLLACSAMATISYGLSVNEIFWASSAKLYRSPREVSPWVRRVTEKGRPARGYSGMRPQRGWKS